MPTSEHKVGVNIDGAEIEQLYTTSDIMFHTSKHGS